MNMLTITARNLIGSFTFAAVLAAAAPARAADPLQEIQDRAAIQGLIVRYATALDTLDADAYAGVFAEDAVFEVGGTTYRGRAEIKGIVTRLIESRSARQARGEAVVNLYHTISNTAIELVDGDEARHQSYYQTVRANPGSGVVIGTMGRYEDVLVKRDGQWLILARKAVNFTR